MFNRFEIFECFSETEKVCKLAFGNDAEILTKDWDEMQKKGLKVRIYKDNHLQTITVLNDYKTNADEQTTENLRFAMTVMYGNRYEFALSNALHEEVDKKLYKLSLRVNKYEEANQKANNSDDEAE